MLVSVLTKNDLGLAQLEPAIKMINACAEKFDFDISFDYIQTQELTEEVLEKLKDSDTNIADISLLGYPRAYEKLAPYAKIATAKAFDILRDKSPLKPHLVAAGYDFLVLSHLGSTYTKYFTTLVSEIAQEKSYPIVSTTEDYPFEYVETNRLISKMLSGGIDNCVLAAKETDGNIFSQLAVQLSGTSQMQSTAFFGPEISIYQLASFIATDLEKFNPIGSFLGAALLLRHSLKQPKAATAVEGAVYALLAAGAHTADLAPEDPFAATTEEITGMIIKCL